MRQLACAGFAAILVTSCRSADALMIDAGERKPIAETEPAAYRIAVLPVTVDSAARSNAQLGSLEFDARDVTGRLVEALHEVRAASHVASVTAGSYDPGDFDLVFVPRLTRQSWEFDETIGGRAALSSLAWLGTWFGGMLIDDKRYDTELELQVTVRNFDRERLRDPDAFTSGPVNLTFWDRNRVLGGYTLLSFIAPPFLIGSSEAKTTETLQDRSLLQIATRWKNYLRWDHTDDQGLRYSLKDVQPENGSKVGGRLDFTCTVRSTERVEIEALALGDRVLDITKYEVQNDGGRDNRVVARNLALDPGDNFVSLRLLVGGVPSRHTFRYTVD